MSELKIKVDTTEAIDEVEQLRVRIEQLEKTIINLSKAASEITRVMKKTNDAMLNLGKLKVRPIL